MLIDRPSAAMLQRGRSGQPTHIGWKSPEGSNQLTKTDIT